MDGLWRVKMLMQAFSSYTCFICFAFVLLSHAAKSCSPTCGLLGWTQWSPCTPMGEQSRDIKLCCPTNLTIQTLEECLRVCNLTMEMAVSKQSCTYIPTTHAAISGFVKSSSVEGESLTTNLVTATDTLDFSTDVANENQTIDSYASTNAPEYEKSTSDVIFDNTVSSKGSTEILTADTSDISISRTTVQSSTSLYQENVVASELQTTYSSNAAETVEYTRDQTFNKQSITEERLGTSVTLAPEASNDRTFVQTSTGEKATSSHEPGYELTSNYMNYSTKEGTGYHVSSETSNARSVII